jgi:hypothetical protein
MMKTLTFIAFLVVAAACAKSEPESKVVANAQRPECASAADCTMTTFTGCCSCCEGAPRAMLKSELHRGEGQCATAPCTKSCKEDLECPKNERLDAFVALCKQGTCVSEKKTK